MRTYQECIPCMDRQIRAAARTATTIPEVRQDVERQAMEAVRSMDMHSPPPVMGQQIHRIVRELTGDPDPYRGIKDRFNGLALKLFPELKARVGRSGHPLEAAVRLAIAGNIIDCGANSELDEAHVHEAVEQALSDRLSGSPAEFADAVSAAPKILYLADNAGEIVFDRLLIEMLPAERVTVAVRGAPVINDATMADACIAGLCDMVEVIDNGSDAPGTILEDCSEAFRRRFDKADLVIAKGQGNYETLSEVEKKVVFLLKVKCPVIGRDIGCEVSRMVLLNNQRRSAAGKGGRRDAGI